MRGFLVEVHDETGRVVPAGEVNERDAMRVMDLTFRTHPAAMRVTVVNPDGEVTAERLVGARRFMGRGK